MPFSFGINKSIMSYKATTIKEMLRNIMTWRKQVNEYLETLDGSSPENKQDKTVTYAALAIVGLLLLGAIILGGMALKLIGFD
jgi:hypothetical protein